MLLLLTRPPSPLLVQVLTSREFKVSGAIGPCSSLRKAAPNVAEIEIGQGGTNQWSMGGIDPATTIAVYFEVTNPANNALPPTKRRFIQVGTPYHPPGRHAAGRHTTSRAGRPFVRDPFCRCCYPRRSRPSSSSSLPVALCSSSRSTSTRAAATASAPPRQRARGTTTPTTWGRWRAPSTRRPPACSSHASRCTAQARQRTGGGREAGIVALAHLKQQRMAGWLTGWC